MTKTLILSTLAAIALCGCAQMTPAQREQAAKTAALVLPRAEKAGEVLIEAGETQKDATTKANFLDSIATGLRSNMLDAKTADDIAAVVDIWAPKAKPYTDLAASLGKIFLAAKASNDAQRLGALEGIASGIQSAAANQRTP